MNALVLVKRNEYKNLVFKFSQKVFWILTPGLYFFPFLWWWGDAESEKVEKQEMSFVHFDGRQVFRTRTLVGRAGFWEDVSREFLVPFLLRKSIWAIVICLIGGYFLARGSIWFKGKFFSTQEIVVKKKTETKNNTAVYSDPKKNNNSAPVYKEQTQNLVVDTTKANFQSANMDKGTIITIESKKNQELAESLKNEENKSRIRDLEEKVKNLEIKKNETSQANTEKSDYYYGELVNQEKDTKEDRERENQFVVQDIKANPIKYSRVSERNYDGFYFEIYAPNQSYHYMAKSLAEMKSILDKKDWMRMMSVINNQYFLDLLDSRRLYFNTPDELFEYAIQNSYTIKVYTVWRR